MSISEKLFTDKSIKSQSGQSNTAWIENNRARKTYGFCPPKAIAIIFLSYFKALKTTVKHNPIRKILFQGIGICIILFNVGCLEIPPTPDESIKVKTIGLWLIKNNQSDSLYFKSNFDIPFVLKAFAKPSIYTEELDFYWYRDKNLLGKSITYEIDTPFVEKQIPNRLEAVDLNNNTLFYDFTVHLNHPPQMLLKTTPNDQDTLFGSNSSSFLFSWSSTDKDEKDLLDHYIKIDKTTYYTGKLTSIQQSGFQPGIHSFTIWVIDSFGDSDTLATKNFIVVDSSGVSK